MNIGARIGYALLMASALGAAFWLLRRNQRSLPLANEQRFAIGMAAFIGSMIGSKIPFLAEAGWSGFLNGTVWLMDGKTMLGGIFGGYLAIEVTKHAMNIRVRTGDSFAMPVAIAIAIGRIACFCVGCCYGTVTTVPWAVRFPLANDLPGVLRHPTQLYEVAFHLTAVPILLLANKYHWLVGHQLKAYLMTYLVYRFVSEWIRPESSWLYGLTAYQVACVALFAMLAGLWIISHSPRGPTEESIAKAAERAEAS